MCNDNEKGWRGEGGGANELRIIQLTDTHLLTDPAAQFDGMVTEESLSQVLALMQQSHWPVDLVLASGDLAHDPTAETYRRLCAMLAALGVPVYCIPGNHDDPDVMQRVMVGPQVKWIDHLCIKGCRIVMLNTHRPNSHGGVLCEKRLQALEEWLALTPDAPVLVCLHHPPVSINSPWMDAMGLANADQLWDVLDRYPAVRGVVWGHIHQAFDETRNGVRLLGTPSTCIQFKPGSDRYVRDALMPGYRWLRLNPAGVIETGINRLSE